MNLPLIFTYYLVWHYTSAFRGIFVIWMNYLWFFYHFFSIGLLARTLFSPWRRLHEAYQQSGGGVDLAMIGSALIVNVIMRIIGVLIRLVFIALGLATLFLIFFGGLLLYLLWVFLPVLIFLLFAVGIFRIL